MTHNPDRLELKGDRRKILQEMQVRAKDRLDDDKYAEALSLVMSYLTNAELDLDRITESSTDAEVTNILSAVGNWERQATQMMG